MRTLRSNLIGVDQGDEELFSDFDAGGEMWTGSGPRERRRAVRFSGRFRTPPTVQVSISLWDVDQSANLRVDLGARNITEDGFDLVLKTWGDTRIARARMAWTAIGELPNEDDWPV